MDRTTFLGASELAGVIGVSRWRSPLSVWAEKKGKIKDKEQTEAMSWGVELENIIAKRFSKVTGLKVRRDNTDYTHPLYPFIKGHIDRRIVGTNSILEVKTCSAYMAKEWEDEEIPLDYIIQTMTYLGLTKSQKGYICCLLGGQKFIWKEIEFDKAMFDNIIERAVDFWNKFILGDAVPIATGEDNQILPDLYPANKNAFGTASFEIEDKIQRRTQMKNEVKELERLVENIDAELKQMIGNNIGIQGEKHIVTWKEQTTKRVDYNKLKEDGLYDKYSYENKIRVLRITNKKEEENG